MITPTESMPYLVQILRVARVLVGSMLKSANLASMEMTVSMGKDSSQIRPKFSTPRSTYRAGERLKRIT